MSSRLGFFFTAVLTLLVVAIQFTYSPISSQKDYQRYRENCIHNSKHPILERYRHQIYVEEEDRVVSYAPR